MARIPDSEIERLKSDISLLRLAESAGITCKKKGKDYHGHCPFHEDDSPSLIITPADNLFHCFGCGAAGSPIDWVMKQQGISFRHAVEYLRNDLSPLAADPKPAKSNKPAKAKPEFTTGDDQALLQRVVAFYHRTLKETPDAQEYLQSRGLDNAELIDTFKLGFANRTLGYRLPNRQTQEGAKIKTHLQNLGILRKSGHEHFNGSLIVPILNDAGQVLEIYGRKISRGTQLRKGTPLHLYLPGPHAGLWNHQSLAASDELILCESIIDAMTFWCAGYRNVTSAYGTEGFSDDMMQAFVDHNIQRVLIAFDRDAAGDTAAEKVGKKLMAARIECFRIQFPKGMDANEYAVKMSPANKALGLVIRKAEWMGKGKAPAIKTAPETITPLAAKQDNPAETSAPESTADTPAPTNASPVPSLADAIPAEITDSEVLMTFADRRYRIRGLNKNLAYEQLKINLLVSRGDLFHVDQLDLYQSRARTAYIKQAAVELALSEDVLKRDLGQVLLKCEALQAEQIEQGLSPNTPTVEISPEDKAEAMALLKAPDLLDRIANDFASCGLVGETPNVLMGYLAAVSRKLDKPLAVIIQSTSAAGKSALMDAVLDLMPEEDRIAYSAMTGQSLYYMGELGLKHKILAIAEEEGVSEAAYALKLLQSQGELTIASTGKDAITGKLETQAYTVEGPVMLFLTTTAIDLDEELLNRCLVLTVNESREQTQAIHDRQRANETLSGLLSSHDKSRITTLHRNAQRLIRPLPVVNPYADQLSFLSDRTRTRRDHQKYLTLIRTVALLHQHQRDIHSIEHNDEVIEYIEATPADIAIANQIAHDVLGRSLDELPPQTRRLLQLIHAQVSEACRKDKINQSDYRFSRKDVRNQTHWSDTALKVHLARLVEMEYLLIHRGARANAYVYELTWRGEGEQGEAFLPGLIDIAQLELDYDAKRSGPKANRSAPGQGSVSPWSGGGQGEKNAGNVETASVSEDEAENTPKRASKDIQNGASHRTWPQADLPLAAQA